MCALCFFLLCCFHSLVSLQPRVGIFFLMLALAGATGMHSELSMVSCVSTSPGEGVGICTHFVRFISWPSTQGLSWSLLLLLFWGVLFAGPFDVCPHWRIVPFGRWNCGDSFWRISVCLLVPEADPHLVEVTARVPSLLPSLPVFFSPRHVMMLWSWWWPLVSLIGDGFGVGTCSCKHKQLTSLCVFLNVCTH